MRQTPDFARDHGKSAASLARTSCFYCGIQRQNVGLESNIADAMRNLIDAVGDFFQIVQPIVQSSLSLLTLSGDIADVTDAAFCQAQRFTLALGSRFQHWQRFHQRRQCLLIVDNPIKDPCLNTVQRFPATQRTLRVMCGVTGILHRELAHRFDVMIKEHQCRERLIDWHAQNFAKAGEAGGSDAFKKVGAVKLISITDTTQDTVVHQNRRRFAMLRGKSLPLLLRRLFEVFLLHQEKPVTKLEVTKKLHATRFNSGDRANEVFPADFNAKG